MKAKPFHQTKRIIGITVLTTVLLSFSIATYAHSGDTDSAGGHYDHSTGVYHYHHGKPAHQHINGVCPYEKNTKTNSIAESTTLVSADTITVQNTTRKNTETSKSSVQSPLIFSSLITAAAFAAIIFGGMWLIEIHAEKKKNSHSSENTLSNIKTTTTEKTDSQQLSPEEIKVLYEHITSLTKSNEFLQDKNSQLESENQMLSDQIAKLSAILEEYKSNILTNEYYSTSVYEELLKEAGVPFGVSFDADALPHYYLNNTVERNFHVYISNNDRHYHRKYNCSGATVPVHLFRVADTYCPCQKCISYRAWNYRIPSWYYKYLDLLQKHFNDSHSNQPESIHYQLDESLFDSTDEEPEI